MSYLLKGQRYLRKYTEKTPSPVYAANIQAAEIVKSLCTVPWEPVAVEEAEMTSHSSEIVDKERSLTGLDWNVENRDLFDAALFCGEHVGGKHRAFANAAVYRYVLPYDAVGRILNSLACTVTSDPYNALGARVHVFTNSTGVIPMSCHDLRGEDASGHVIANGTTAAGVAPRTVDGSGSWFAASERCTLSMGRMSGGGLVMAKYLFIAVTLENYNAWRGNWLEGCSYMENLVEINTAERIEGLADDPAVNDCSIDADNPEHSYEVVKGAVVPSVASDDVGTPLYHVTLARNGDKLQTPVTEMTTDWTKAYCYRDLQISPLFYSNSCAAQFAIANDTHGLGRRTFQNLDFLIYNAITGKPIVTDLDLHFDDVYSPFINGIRRVEIVPHDVVESGSNRIWTFEIAVVIDSSYPEYDGKTLSFDGGDIGFQLPYFKWTTSGLLGEGSITAVGYMSAARDAVDGLYSIPYNLGAKYVRVVSTRQDFLNVHEIYAADDPNPVKLTVEGQGNLSLCPMMTRDLGLEFALIGEMRSIDGEAPTDWLFAIVVRATISNGRVTGWTYEVPGWNDTLPPAVNATRFGYAFPTMNLYELATQGENPYYYNPDPDAMNWPGNPWKFSPTRGDRLLEFDETVHAWNSTELPNNGIGIWRATYLYRDSYHRVMSRHPKLAADVTADDAAIGLRMAYGCVYEGRVEPIQTNLRFGAAFSLSQATTVRLLDSIGETMTVPCWQIVLGALVVPFACPLDFVAKAIRLDWTQDVSGVFNSGAKVFVYLNRGSFESGHTLELKQKSDFWVGGTAVAPYEKIATIENLQSALHLSEVIKIAPLTSRVATLVFTAGFSADDRNPPLSELTHSGGEIRYDLSTGKVIANYDGNSAGFRPDITLIG